jgi:hypothetical protein
MNESKVDRVLLLLLLATIALEDSKGQESKTTIPSLMQLLRYDDGTPTPLFFNLYVAFAKFCKGIDCLSFLQVFGGLRYVSLNNA